MFYLGNYQQRSSFAAQQTRALNLVWALSKSDQVKRGGKVALVGTGVSAITTAAALANLNIDVEYFGWSPNKGSQPFLNWLNPHASEWPEISPRDHSIFNAPSANAAAIVSGISQSFWDTNFPGRVLDLGAFKGLKRGNAEQVEIVGAPGPISTLRYDAIVLADSDLNGAGYWVRDEIEDLTYSTKTVIVSGCTDGGVVDVLRSVYRNFWDPKLLEAITNSSDGEFIRRAIKIAEGGRRDGFEEIEVYQNVVSAIDYVDSLHSISKLLSESIVSDKRVVLADSRYTSPLLAPITPVHKLLLAYAMRRGTVVYFQGTPKKGNEGVHIGPMFYRSFESVLIDRQPRSLFEPSLRRLGLRERSSQISSEIYDFDVPLWAPRNRDEIGFSLSGSVRQYSRVQQALDIGQIQSAFAIATLSDRPPLYPREAFGIETEIMGRHISPLDAPRSAGSSLPRIFKLDTENSSPPEPIDDHDSNLTLEITKSGGVSEGNNSVDIMFVTTRAKDTRRGGYFSRMRSDTDSYGSATIRVPEERDFGTVCRPWLSVPLGAYTFNFPAENSKKHFVLQNLSTYSFEQWSDTIKASGKDQALVFVHGFKTTFMQGMYQCAQIMWDIKFEGLPVYFSWASGGKVGDYEHDRNSALVARPRFAKMLGDLRSAGVKTVHVLAHSMGNFVVLDAIANHNHGNLPLGIGEVLMAAPDVDADHYRSIGPKVRAACSGMTLYASSVDKALKLSKAIAGNIPRAGDVYDGKPIILQNVDSIDVTAVGAEIFGLNHGVFASEKSILNDVKLLLAQGLRPPTKRLAEIGGMPVGLPAQWWRYLR